ncbi:hypothetical protein FOL47_003660 [Perkinsus chesapeaki]|uniref:LITAF domain-containing protein n=1 Tax=Perkinsus chesapeaki TaxID=330153 RepID=A0A7J6M6R7_PERCH|nr:hypothetical protein FOL47_003660 [Perkinsus chesapeaki]
MSDEEQKAFVESQAPIAPAPMANVYFSDEPMPVTCPYCKATTTTMVEHKVSAGSWICVAILVLLCFPLAWIPCCCDSCQQADHRCGNCHQKEIDIDGKRRYLQVVPEHVCVVILPLMTAPDSYGTEQPLAPVASVDLGHSPDYVECSRCGHKGLSIVEHRSSCDFTYLYSLLNCYAPTDSNGRARLTRPGLLYFHLLLSATYPILPGVLGTILLP